MSCVYSVYAKFVCKFNRNYVFVLPSLCEQRNKLYKGVVFYYYQLWFVWNCYLSKIEIKELSPKTEYF